MNMVLKRISGSNKYSKVVNGCGAILVRINYWIIKWILIFLWATSEAISIGILRVYVLISD